MAIQGKLLRFLDKEIKDHGTKEGTADFEKAMEMCGKPYSLNSIVK